LLTYALRPASLIQDCKRIAKAFNLPVGEDENSPRGYREALPLPFRASVRYHLPMQEKYILHEDEDGTYAILDAKSYEVVEKSGMVLQNMEWQWVESLIPLLEAIDQHKELPN